MFEASIFKAVGARNDNLAEFAANRRSARDSDRRLSTMLSTNHTDKILQYDAVFRGAIGSAKPDRQRSSPPPDRNRSQFTIYSPI
ncbi:hypothetical protein [Chamaesiphon sp.]|uniref:hypothetical protein n=1 Tax=Chamaesiphon sp. TaxID=2814140 RepID=UPI0035944408